MALIESTVPRLERNQAGIDELEELARKFAEFRQFWPARLTSIENVLSSTLGAEAGAGRGPPEQVAVQPDKHGLTLRAFLDHVSKALEVAMPDSCWVVTKLTDFSRHADHIYLDVLESQGKEIAKARVTMFANVAGNVIAERERVTGGLPPGGHTRAAQGASRVLATIRLSLNATGLDPSYALGDMQAKLQEIIFLLPASCFLPSCLPGDLGAIFPVWFASSSTARSRPR